MQQANHKQAFNEPFCLVRLSATNIINLVIVLSKIDGQHLRIVAVVLQQLVQHMHAFGELLPMEGGTRVLGGGCRQNAVVRIHPVIEAIDEEKGTPTECWNLKTLTQ